MNALQTFQFHTHKLSIIVDDAGEPWFIAKQVADILEYSDAHKMTNKLDSDEKSNRQIGGLTDGAAYGPNFGGRGITCINEFGLYNAIISSKKPAAKAFKRWVTHEVLPSIRKTGAYGIPLEIKATVHALQAELLKARPRLHKVLKLSNAGFSKAESSRMLGVGETTVRKEHSTLKACGFAAQPIGTQLDLFGGE